MHKIPFGDNAGVLDVDSGVGCTYSFNYREKLNTKKIRL